METTLATLESKAQRLMDNKVIVTTPSGTKGRITRLIPYRYVAGIKSVEVSPVRDADYFNTKAQLRDDWVSEVEEWVEMVHAAKLHGY